MLSPNTVDSRFRRVLWILGQAALVIIGIVAYFSIRHVTEGSEDVAVDHALDIVAFQESMGIGIEAALQAPVAGSHVLQALANWIYIWGHWPVIIVTMIWLAWRHVEQFRRLRDGMMVSGALGMLIYASYPVAPPRLAGLGLIDTVSENSSAYRVLQPPSFVNQYAAMPSLHFGWDLLVGMAIFSAATTTLVRVVGAMMPLLMAYAVIATANHYVLDVVGGLLLVMVGHAAAVALEQRRERRAEARRQELLREAGLTESEAPSEHSGTSTMRGA
jgi:membrane-associated phospholipid phosphatase